MKTKYLLPAVTFALILNACGSKEGSKENKEEGNEQKEEKIDEAPVEEISYEAFDSAKLEGNWKVIDVQAYSKDQMIGQTYSFMGDTATFFKNTGDAGMAKGDYTIEENKLLITWRKEDENGRAKITFEFDGGFFEEGKKLQMNASDMIITLERQ